MNEERINLGRLIHYRIKGNKHKCLEGCLDDECYFSSSKGVIFLIDDEDYEDYIIFINEMIVLLSRGDCKCEFWCEVYEKSTITHFKVSIGDGEVLYEYVFEYKNSDSDKLNEKKNKITKIVNEN